MGTGPRGGKKVREREAAAANDAAPAAADDDAHRQQQPESKRTRLDDAPAKPTGAGGVDPADVDRKTAVVLEKKGFAAAAVARALKAVAPSADDSKKIVHGQYNIHSEPKQRVR